MRAALILDGVVKNVVVAGQEFFPGDGFTMIELPEGSPVSLGWTFAANTFTAPVEQPSPVPEAVTARQARLALLGAGLLATIEQALAAMPGVQGDAARIEWEYALEIRRDSPLIGAIAPALGLTGAQVDDLFRAAQPL